MRAIAFLAFSAASTAAIAGPPLLTDDPEPVDLHHVEVDVIGQQILAFAGRAGTLCAAVNVGCAAETQCHIALPVAFANRAGGSSRAGLGDVEFGVKYRFYNQSDGGWSAAVYPTLELPTGNAGHGLGNGRAHQLVRRPACAATVRPKVEAGRRAVTAAHRLPPTSGLPPD